MCFSRLADLIVFVCYVISCGARRHRKNQIVRSKSEYVGCIKIKIIVCFTWDPHILKSFTTVCILSWSEMLRKSTSIQWVLSTLGTLCMEGLTDETHRHFFYFSSTDKLGYAAKAYDMSFMYWSSEITEIQLHAITKWKAISFSCHLGSIIWWWKRKMTICIYALNTGRLWATSIGHCGKGKRDPSFYQLSSFQKNDGRTCATYVQYRYKAHTVFCEYCIIQELQHQVR